jgi:DHA1 family bicyclomycin/chloramphenicol resistance-like MFS transporter
MRLVRVGSLMISAALVALGLADAVGHLDPATLFVPTFFVGVANGLVTPNCVALGIAIRPRLAGTAAGVASGLQLGMGALASTVVGLWLAGDRSAVPLVAQMAVVALLTVATTLVAARLFRRGD